MRSLYLLLFFLFSNSCAVEKQSMNTTPILFQENAIVSAIKDYKKLGESSWFFSKIATIKNAKDQEYLRNLVYALEKNCEMTIEKINSLKKNFENFYKDRSGKNEIQNNVDELSQKLEDCVYLKTLIKNIVEFCLKNSTENESVIEKALGKQPSVDEASNSKSLSNLKKVFEQIIRKVEELKEEEQKK